VTASLRVEVGPWLLRSISPDLATHRSLRGPLPRVGRQELLDLADGTGLRGRGGAGFPFAAKLRATLSVRARRRHVVVNLSEGEPASAKDLALVLHQPHLVLDGAALVAGAIGAREAHLVVPGEEPVARVAILRAVAERSREDRRLRWRVHTASAGFVSGESTAVVELVEGRENLPVTRWQPTAVSGVGGRPTLLSNGETFAQLAALVLDHGAGRAVPGTAAEPGTRLLSIGQADGSTRVVEVPHGTAWNRVLSPAELAAPVLLGGYHGTWAPAGLLAGLSVTHADLAAAGLGLGAGVVLPLAEGICPLRVTAGVTRYLARQSAGRCGPCVHGLPTLATTFDAFLAGGPVEPVEQVLALVEGRGACAHPDGTARLVRSALLAFPAEVSAHAVGGCAAVQPTLAGAR
jgi:NADH:ubiquinone oxidoreductase subunit F (NADH-binding)